jgi:hypothetical protein
MGTPPLPLAVDDAGKIVGASYASPFPTPNGYSTGFAEPANGVVFHTEVGYEHNVIAEFENPGAQASAFVSNALDGTLTQYGPLFKKWAAWTQAQGNARWRGIENEDQGNPANPLTDAQLWSMAGFVELCAHVDGFAIQITDDPTNGRGLITHQDGGQAWGGHSCPAPVRTAQRALIVARALNLAAQRNGVHPAVAAVPAPVANVNLGDSNPSYTVVVPLDPKGNGCLKLDGLANDLVGVGSSQLKIESSKVLVVEAEGSNPALPPAGDGAYWGHVGHWQDHGGFPIVSVTGGPLSGQANLRVVLK